MRLKHGEDAIAAGRFRRGQRRANLGRMMGVIVHQQEPIALVFDFEPPPRVLEAAQRSDDLLEWYAQLRGEGDHPEGIAHVMAARNVQDRFAELLAAAKNTKDGCEIPKIDVGAAIIRFRRQPEGDGTGARSANSPGVRIIRTIKDRSGCLIEQLAEDALDRGEVCIIIEMFLLDVQDERVLRLEQAQRPVALVAFRREILAASIPMGV